MSSKTAHSRKASKHSKATHGSTHAQRQRSQQAGKTAVVVLVVVLAVVLAGVVYLMMQMRGPRTSGSVELAEPAQGGLAGLFGKKTVKPTPTPTVPVNAVPTMVPRPLPKGEQDFMMSLSDQFAGPKPTEIIVSEFTMTANKAETVKVMINKATPATSVKGVVSTDTKETPFALSLESESGSTQVWTGNWMMNDSVNKNYVLKFTATGASGTSQFAVAAR